MGSVTDDDRREYLVHLEEIARAGYRPRQLDPVSWAIDRHMTRAELLLARVWRTLSDRIRP